MGELVDLAQYRQSRAAPVPSADPADPETYGWLVIEEDDAGEPVRWFHPRRVAQIGFVPQAPEWVFLDHQSRIRAWRTLGVGELAVHLERGSLPEPDVT